MKKWQQWTAEQDAVLMEHGNEGAEECARILRRVFKVDRSAAAVRRHAYRIGAPMVVYAVCCGCGQKARMLDADGLCAACHQRAVAERYERETDAIRAAIEAGEADGSRMREARRYAKARKARERMLRRLCGDSASCHTDLSNPSSKGI